MLRVSYSAVELSSSELTFELVFERIRTTPVCPPRAGCAVVHKCRSSPKASLRYRPPAVSPPQVPLPEELDAIPSPPDASPAQEHRRRLSSSHYRLGGTKRQRTCLQRLAPPRWLSRVLGPSFPGRSGSAEASPSRAAASPHQRPKAIT